MGTRWKVWEKIVGTLLFPGGLAGVSFFLSRGVWESSSTPVEANAGSDPVNPLMPDASLIATLVILAIPLLVAVYLLIVGLMRHPAAHVSLEQAVSKPSASDNTNR